MKGCKGVLINKIVENQKNKKTELNNQCKEIISELSDAILKADAILSEKEDFISLEMAEQWREENKQLKRYSEEKERKKYRKTECYSELTEKCKKLAYLTDNILDAVRVHNRVVDERLISDAEKLIGKVEGRNLDKQQLICVVHKSYNHLVIAGAGTGKTTTIIGKIKYLLQSNQYNPEDILVLSFTNASAHEMSERIQKETGLNIEASTFHKLGLNIIKSVNCKVPKITTINLKSFVQKQVESLIKDSGYLKMLGTYLLYNRTVAKSEFDFKNQKEYDEYLQMNPPITFLGERVKSYGEMDIANFLFQNGINYSYEASYKLDTNDEEHGQYHPDFYLPDYDIYLEYFGINKEGKVPDYFAKKNGKSASEIYNESIQWKRRLHRENNTLMIETFAYEKYEGILLSKLENELIKAKVEFKSLSPQEMWNRLNDADNSLITGAITLFETIINLIKSNNYSIDNVRGIISDRPDFIENNRLLNLVEPIFNAYDTELKTNNEIDFSDMINYAADLVRSGQYKHKYKYVIVDEYQDISKARFSLLAEMRKSQDYNLFCVGDDWQSIYRFAGSDINYILNFEKFWGSTEISKIETTYRFSQSLVDISGDFVMNNPYQIKKQINGLQKGRFALGEINGYTEKLSIDFLTEKLDDLPQNSTAFFIGRYIFDSKLLSESDKFKCYYNNETGQAIVVYLQRQDLKMEFITAHKSKGLQADYVFIINNKKSRMGFPSVIQDAPMVNLLLEASEDFPFAEERRLYYVALTRAKVKTYLVTVRGKESVFVDELKTRYGENLKREKYECPLCGGKLEKRKGPYGEFFGCSNYRSKGCKYTRKIKSSSK